MSIQDLNQFVGNTGSKLGEGIYLVDCDTYSYERTIEVTGDQVYTNGEKIPVESFFSQNHILKKIK